MSVMQEFLDFIADIMQVDSSELSAETRYEEFRKWDSLMHLRLVMEVEEKYNVEIPIEDIPNIKTLNNLYQFVKI